jgi:hypothetical protein
MDPRRINTHNQVPSSKPFSMTNDSKERENGKLAKFDQAFDLGSSVII